MQVCDTFCFQMMYVLCMCVDGCRIVAVISGDEGSLWGQHWAARVCSLLMHWPAGYCQIWLCHKSIHRENIHRLLKHTGLSASITILVSITWRVLLLNFSCSKYGSTIKPRYSTSSYSVTLIWLPWKTVNRKFLLCSTSTYSHLRYSATNCGV
jgi:hypothetical protein